MRVKKVYVPVSQKFLIGSPADATLLQRRPAIENQPIQIVFMECFVCPFWFPIPLGHFHFQSSPILTVQIDLCSHIVIPTVGTDEMLSETSEDGRGGLLKADRALKLFLLGRNLGFKEGQHFLAVTRSRGEVSNILLKLLDFKFGLVKPSFKSGPLLLLDIEGSLIDLQFFPQFNFLPQDVTFFLLKNFNFLSTAAAIFRQTLTPSAESLIESFPFPMDKRTTSSSEEIFSTFSTASCF